jgi:hypothetical protein
VVGFNIYPSLKEAPSYLKINRWIELCGLMVGSVNIFTKFIIYPSLLKAIRISNSFLLNKALLRWQCRKIKTNLKSYAEKAI